MTKFIINTDGGARGNPGPAAVGIVINKFLENNTTEIIKIGKYIGATTNNIAEYTALIEALKAAREQKGTNLECLLDSELVVKQLNGQYKVKDVNLNKLWHEIKTLEKLFQKVSYTHIPREQNKQADKIVNEVLDSIELKNG